MNTLPNPVEGGGILGIRPAGEPLEQAKVILSRGTPLAGKTVSLFRHPVEVIGADGVSFRRIEALVDTGASYLTVPETLLGELGIEPAERIRLRLADGRYTERYISEARVRIADRVATTTVVFVDDAAPILLGAHALESVRLCVDPLNKSLVDFTPLL